MREMNGYLFSEAREILSYLEKGEFPKTPVKSLFFKNNYDPTIHRNLFYYCTLSSFKITKNYSHLHQITITRINFTVHLQKHSQILL